LSEADMRDSTSLSTHNHIEMSDACRMFFARIWQSKPTVIVTEQSTAKQAKQRTDLLSVDGIAEPLPILAFCGFSESAGRKLLES